jgi:hypothetical protein
MVAVVRIKKTQVETVSLSFQELFISKQKIFHSVPFWRFKKGKLGMT